MTGVAPTHEVADSSGLPLRWRVRTMRLEFGPSRSRRELCRALGEALARARLVANRVELVPTVDGYVLHVECEAGDNESEVLDALTCLLDNDAPEPGRPPSCRSGTRRLPAR